MMIKEQELKGLTAKNLKTLIQFASSSLYLDLTFL